MEMTPQYDYGSALVPRETVICGVTLRPFSLGHIILLEETSNPLISKDEIPVTKAEGAYRLFQALLICALTYEEGLELLNDKEKWLAEWARFEKNLIANMDVDPNWNLYIKLQMFKNYMSYYVLSMPDYKILHRDEKSTNSGTDWRAAIKVMFKKLNYTQSEILNMGLDQLFQEWTVNAEGEGSIKVFDKYTSDKIKAANKRMKEQQK